MTPRVHEIDTLPTWTNTPPLFLYFSIFNFFQAGKTLAWFSLVFSALSRVRLSIKAQAAARVGRPGILDGTLKTPEKAPVRIPQL
jgi:hypothetical protein